MFTADEKDELIETVREIKTRQAEMYAAVNAITKAFPKNDLAEPDFDGHRKDHLQRREGDRILTEYKVDSTKKILWSVITLLTGLMALGFSEQLRMILFK